MDPIVESFDRVFRSLHGRSSDLIANLPADLLFHKPRELDRSMAIFSTGEYVLRSAAAVEQTFGGITTRLWDDPFEWTLPEELASVERVTQYLDEVEAMRGKGMKFFRSDAELMQQIPAPEALRSIFDILLDTIARAALYQGRAFAVFQMISDEKLPRI
jgi:hypothetical protein